LQTNEELNAEMTDYLSA